MTMPSIVEQILARIQSALREAAFIPAERIERSRDDAWGEDELPAINIRRNTTNTQPMSFESDQVTLSFTLAIYVSGSLVETAADALHAAAHAALFTDSQLLAIGHHTLRPTGTDNDADDVDRAVYQLNCHYEIDAWVSRADITQSV